MTSHITKRALLNPRHVALAALLALTHPALAAVTTVGDTFVSAEGALFLGNASAGAATITFPGATFPHIAIGNGADGELTVSGTGTVLNATNTIQTGALSAGRFLIQGGAVVNIQGGASPFAGCTNCNSTPIGNGGGASGTLTVTGTGSQLNVADGLGVGALFLVGNGFVGPGFGTPGAPTSGTFNVLSGATASTVATIIGNSNLITGQSLATGVVNVDGAGSRWTVNATTSNVSFINVGSLGHGTLNITKGGRVDATYLNVGVDNGSTGTLTIDGTGSLLSLTGGTQQFGGAGLLVGWNAGASGSLSVTNGGHILIDARGAGAVGGGMTIGGLGSGGVGIMTVSGTGSLVEIKGDTATSSIGPGFTVGRSGHGQLSILSGGKITIEDANPTAFAGFSVGGNEEQFANGDPAGNGTLLVSGAGSELAVNSPFGSFTIGHTNGSVGQMTIAAGGKVSAEQAYVGLRAGGTGSVTVTGVGSNLLLSGSDASFGAFLHVGRAGTGTLNVLDGGMVSISAANGAPFGGVHVGGSGLQAANEVGGIGTVNVGSNGRIEVTGDKNVQIVLGEHQGGVGTLNITGGGQVTLSRPANPADPNEKSGVLLGAAPGAHGVALVQGQGSLLDGGAFIGIGADRTGSQGSGVLTVRDGGTAMADVIRIGSGGVLNGNGTVHGAVTNDGGIIAPGNSPGTLTIVGSLVSTGIIEIQVEGLGAGQFDVLNVVGPLNLSGATVRFLFEGGYLPKTGDSFTFLERLHQRESARGYAIRLLGRRARFPV